MLETAAAKSSVFPSLNVRQSIKLALSLTLFYLFGLWSNQSHFNYGALAIVICSMGTRGATIEKGIARVIGTTFGVVVGLIILALFNHDRWATMMAFSCYLVFVSYFMQGSRDDYAWFVAAFVPLVVWGDNFPHFDQGFNFAADRWLETTLGVVLYTTVDLLLWPRQAGDQLNQLGQSLWADVQELVAGYRTALKQVDTAESISELPPKITGVRAAAMASLQQAYLDTPEVRARKHEWEAWRNNTEAMLDALALWHPAIDDVRPLNLDQLIPQLDSALQTLEARIVRIRTRWQHRFTEASGVTENWALDGDDLELLRALDLEVDRSADAELSHFQRAALSYFLAQLKTLDETSRDVLRSERALSDLDTSTAIAARTSRIAPFQSTPWVQRRFVHALFPAAAFASAFLFWVFMYPPTGPKVPMMAGILALALLRTPMDPIKLVLAFLVSVLFAVAPVSWLVMPHLGTGFELLCLIFVYSFVFGYLGGHNPLLKMGPMIMFVMMSGISNEQSYSFNGFIDPALMIVLGGGFVVLAYLFFSTLRPEVTLLKWLERFFAGCAQFFGECNFQDVKQRDKWRASRRRTLESMVLPAPTKIQAAQKQLDSKLYPDTTSEKLVRLHDCVQSIAFRLQSLETVMERAAAHLPDHHEPLAPLSHQLQEIVQDVFQHWAKPESDLDLEMHRSSLERVSEDLQSQLDTLAEKTEQERLSDRALSDLYGVVGSVRGLIHAMSSTQTIMQQINWQQLATSRF